jgi:azurin
MTRYFALPALLLATLVAGCSAPPAGETGATAPASSGASPTAAAPATQVHDGRAIEITGNDTMKFSVTEITAKPGEKLSVTLVNIGTTPKFSMGHNWLLLTQGVDIQPFLVASAEAVTTDYVPRATDGNKILAATKLLGPNERDTVTFTAPTSAGRYDFLCSFPGHFQVGMRGVLIVQ